MYEVLNIDEIKNYLHSLVELYETNLLSLISQCLDNNSQIQMKLLQCLPSHQTLCKCQFGRELNAALNGIANCVLGSRQHSSSYAVHAGMPALTGAPVVAVRR